MARTTPSPLAHDAFLASLRARHQERGQRGKDRAYEAMMYRARDPPGRTTLEDLVAFTRNERREAPRAVPIPDDPAVPERLGRILRTMQWPDPAPLAAVGEVLPEWDTLHASTLLHTMIPDYPIWGPSERAGLARLGIEVPYHDTPDAAVDGYGAYVLAVKRLRDEARFEHVPESHHYLTRIVQVCLQELGDTA